MINRRHERGYTLYELFVSIIAFLAVAACVGVLFVLVHFVVKFW